MHLTVRVRPGVPGLRRTAVLDVLRVLLRAARERGLRTVALAVLPTHVHWVVMTPSAAVLRDATRYVLGRLAKHLNRLFGRRGPVFEDRYWSTCCRTARAAWNVLGYVLRNPWAAGCHTPAPGRRPGVPGIDAYTGVDEELLATNRFLRAVVGPTDSARRAVLARMCAGPAPFVPLVRRLQPRLPGL